MDPDNCGIFHRTAKRRQSGISSPFLPRAGFNNDEFSVPEISSFENSI
jgi:hypothetical protein